MSDIDSAKESKDYFHKYDDAKEKLPSENGSNAGFKGIRSGTEANAAGSTRVEVGTPGKAQREIRNDKSGSMSTDRFPLHGNSPKKDKFGETLNSGHPIHGR